jgi:hypothetical protein
MSLPLPLSGIDTVTDDDYSLGAVRQGPHHVRDIQPIDKTIPQ